MLSGDMNVKVISKEVRNVRGLCGVSGMNENGRKLIDICAGNRLSVGKMLYEKSDIHKFTWKSLLDGCKSVRFHFSVGGR